MGTFQEALKWATRAAGAPGVAGLFGKGTEIGSAAQKIAPVAKPFGVGLNLAGAGLGVANAYNGYASGDADAGWDGVGQAAAGTIGAASAGTPFGAAWAAARLLADGAGYLAEEAGGEDAGFNFNHMLGSHYRGLFGDESIGGDVAEALGGGFWGHAAGTALNLTPAGLVVNGADNILGGTINTIGNILDSDEGVRDDYWGQAKGAAGDMWDWITD